MCVYVCVCVCVCVFNASDGLLFENFEILAWHFGRYILQQFYDGFLNLMAFKRFPVLNYMLK